MARVSVKLPVGMTTADGRREVECDAATVGEALGQAVAVEPRLKPRIFRDDGRMWAGVFLNGRNINAREGIATVLEDGDTMKVVPPISGG
ncbi:MAG: MoaD/ThiS family protein [Thermoleophilia bacterium]|nr:MoaD/ThiS family protein [Thermoleophilia bacterium]